MNWLRRPSKRDVVTELFSYADIAINGERPQDIKVHNPRFYERVLAGSSLGLGESYMAGDWDADSVDETINNITNVRLREYVQEVKGIKWQAFLARHLNNRSVSSSRRVAQDHYDLGNDLYIPMLGGDPTDPANAETHAFMQYTCAYRGNDPSPEDFDLRKDEIRKLELICRKAELESGQSVLELGSGFGGFGNYAATNHGVEVKGYNISKQQIEFSRRWNENLPVTVIDSDYRFAHGQFDRVVSIGLGEHADPRELMQTAHRNLKQDGLFVVHMIGRREAATSTDPWIDRYIFPGGNLPSLSQLSTAAEGLFTIQDFHNFGPDYDPTLMAWYQNFTAAWPELENTYGHKANGQFKRMWDYYLLSCAGAFRISEPDPRSMKNQLFQLVLAKSPTKKYVTVREF